MLRYGRHTFILGRVFPWKGFGGKVSEGGMCWVTRIPLPPRYLLKETLVTVGYPLPHWAHSDGPGFPWAGRAWISIAQWAHPLPDGPGFPWGNGPIHGPGFPLARGWAHWNSGPIH